MNSSNRRKRHKGISSSVSSGNAGGDFENRVQASYAALMLTGGYAPCLSGCVIKKIKLQGGHLGYEIDDFIVYARDANRVERKLLGQVKLTVSVTVGNPAFRETLQRAWRDFNNEELFHTDLDSIALLTAALNRTDNESVPWILEQVRASEFCDDFKKRLETQGFRPSDSPKKWNVFLEILKEEEPNITEPQLWEFLRHFSILVYDLEKEESVVLSLLHSHLSRHNTNPQNVWEWIVSYISFKNRNASEIPREEMKRKFLARFPDSKRIKMPVKFQRIESSEIASDLAVACLIGQWDEKNDADVAIIRKVNPDLNYRTWIDNLTRLINEPNSPITLNDGIWKVQDRTQLWETFGPFIYRGVEGFMSVAIQVLSEMDPTLDLPELDRIMAPIWGMVPTYSPQLRYGLAEGVTLLGTHSNAACWPQGGSEAAENAARKIVSALLDGQMNWQRWASLNPVHSLLAEAAPNEFLGAVEGVLSQENSPIDAIFQQESSGTFGRNFMTQLLWALELLAWDPKLLVRVCCILGHMAERDPGGNWANRPDSSLVSILLPWHPQTLADVEKRLAAERTLVEETPNAAWNLLLRFLPGKTATATIQGRKSYRFSIPQESNVTPDEYDHQVGETVALLVSLAADHPERLAELAESLQYLQNEDFQTTLETISTIAPNLGSDDDKRKVWESLLLLKTRHVRFSDADWAMSSKQLKKLDAIIETLTPSDWTNRFKILFGRVDFDLYESDDSKKEEEALTQKRKTAIQQILQKEGLEGILRFADLVDKPWIVGGMLGENYDFDKELLPTQLSSREKSRKEFTESYVTWRCYTTDWKWIDTLPLSEWTAEQKCQFFLGLPPDDMRTWKMVESLPKAQQEFYWKNVQVFRISEFSDRIYALERLIKFDNIGLAVRHLANMIRSKDENQKPPVSLCISALLDETDGNNGTLYDIVEIIDWLQNQPEVDPKTMKWIEFRHLPLLNSTSRLSPVFLERDLASDPEFFSEVLCSVYKSRNKESVELSEKNRQISPHARRLLYQWTLVPGTDELGVFHPEKFQEWLRSVEKLARETGHLSVAMQTIGSVLIYSPKDEDGFWIHRTVAEVLNKPENEQLRRGFETGKYNALGIHDVDPENPIEARLSQDYAALAETTENAGFYRLAQALRSLSASYQRDAEKIRQRHSD